MSRLTSRGGATRLWVPVLRRDPCVYCGGEGGTVEHVTPRSFFKRKFPHAWGKSADHWSNLASACVVCNSERQNKGLLLYLLERIKDARP